MNNRIITLAMFLVVASACGTTGQTARPSTEPLLTVTLVGAEPATVDSMTSWKLSALVAAAKEIAGSSGTLPASISEILSHRRETAHVSPQPDWAVDGWGRPFVLSLHSDRSILLVLSAGADGALGGGDDLFETVRKR